MAENSKYDVILNELTSAESQVLVLANKTRDTLKRNRELEEQSQRMKKENFELMQRVSRLEKEIEDLKEKEKEFAAALEAKSNLEQNAAAEADLFNSLNLKERENLKLKLQSLITKINYHLTEAAH